MKLTDIPADWPTVKLTLIGTAPLICHRWSERSRGCIVVRCYPDVPGGPIVCHVTTEMGVRPPQGRKPQRVG